MPGARGIYRIEALLGIPTCLLSATLAHSVRNSVFVRGRVLLWAFFGLSNALCGHALSASAAQISTFQAGNGGWHLGTMAIGNLDADPAHEIVVPYRNLEGQWFLDAFNHDGTR